MRQARVQRGELPREQRMGRPRRGRLGDVHVEPSDAACDHRLPQSDGDPWPSAARLYDPTNGNLAAKWIPLSDSSPVGSAAVQLAQLSLNFGAATVTSGFADDASLASSLPYGGVATAAPLAVPSPSDFAAYAADTLTATGDVGSLTLSLADITRLTDPSLLPSSVFAPSSSILVGIVGDPSASVAQIDAGGDASYDGHGLHMIAVPMNPAPDAGK